MREFLIGKLNGHALPHEWFTIAGSVTFILGAAAVVGFITYKKRWTWLWKEWLTSVDPKKIGIMYFIVAGFMLVRGILDAVMIWLQQALASGSNHGYLHAEHFQQVFTAHGNIMVFFVAMALVFGLINYIVPLQIGARDLASPFMNTLGFWLFVAGVVMVNMFFLVGGEYAATGWLAIAPLSAKEFSPGVGVDYWIWSLQISGIGTTLGAINFIITILKMRVKTMKLFEMPLFTWGSLCSMLMAVSIFPILTMTIFLLFFDRYLGTNFFTTGGGGNIMLYSNLIWMWGHPEVYVLVLPAYGVFSEVVATFSGKRIANHKSTIFGLIGVSTLALGVWLHHFFTMGAGANVNAFFGLVTVAVAVPTTVLMFNWISTMYKGRIHYSTPMMWFLGFVAVFTLGGITGVMLALPPADFQLHNSLFLVAHFHSTVIGGVVFGIFCGFNYWFPKMTGFRLNERIGKQAFWAWIIGFFMAFIPMFALGLMGATRRLDHYESSTGYQPLYIMSLIGGLVICVGVALQIIQIIASFIEKRRLVDTTGDPWNGRTLEWSVASPAPAYNFAKLPERGELDGFWKAKKDSYVDKRPYEDIHMPESTATGIYVSLFAFLSGFGFVWEINWLGIGSLIGIVWVLIARTFKEDSEYTIPAHEVEKQEKETLAKAAKAAERSHSRGEEMGLIDFIKFVLVWALGLLRRRKA